MTKQTHLMIQCLLGALNTFVAFPGLELPVFASALIHAVLSGLTIALAVKAQNFNTDGTPQTKAFTPNFTPKVKKGKKEDSNG